MLSSVILYTHSLTPTFTKLQILGFLHVVRSFSMGVSYQVIVASSGFAVNVRTSKNIEEFKASMLNALRQWCENILKIRQSRSRSRKIVYTLSIDGYEIDNLFLYSGPNPTLLLKSVQNISVVSPDDVDMLFRPELHDRRSGGKSPTLLLAPELGKYSTASIPYTSSYPSPIDVSRRRGVEVSLCMLMALMGLGYCSFKSTIRAPQARKREHVFAYPAPRAPLDYVSTRILYYLGARLSQLSSMLGLEFVIGRDRYELSVPGLLALLSPVIKDVMGTASAGALSRLELGVYSVEIEGQKQAVRLLTSVSLEGVERLPPELAGAMLARIRDLRSLVVHAPEFFNLLGEYLLSGDGVLYIEALRSLASLMHNSRAPEGAKSVARFLLEHATR